LTDSAGWLRAGTVGRPHGLDGSFHVGDCVPDLLPLDGAVMVAGRERRIARRAGTASRLIVRFEGCEDRQAARALGGAEILVARARAPELDEDEWWADDLEGCRVRDGSTDVGVVQRLIGLPSCEVLEVARDAGGDALLVPLVRDAVRAVDVGRRLIDVDLQFLGEA
jgi:16S rRNA processing protein RimM